MSAKNRVASLYSAALSIALDTKRDMLSHDEYLELRTQRLFKHANWERVPNYVRNEVLAYLMGAMAIIEREHIEYYHIYRGKFVPRFTQGIDYSEIDSNESRFRWKADLTKVWN